jgi:hypothetical protein
MGMSLMVIERVKSVNLHVPFGCSSPTTAKRQKHGERLTLNLLSIIVKKWSDVSLNFAYVHLIGRQTKLQQITIPTGLRPTSTLVGLKTRFLAIPNPARLIRFQPKGHTCSQQVHRHHRLRRLLLNGSEPPLHKQCWLRSLTRPTTSQLCNKVWVEALSYTGYSDLSVGPIVSNNDSMNIDSMGIIAPTVTGVSPASAPPAFSDSTQGSTPPIAPTGSGLDKLYLLLIQLTLMFFSVGFRPIVSNIDSMGTIAPTVTSISPASAPPAFSDSAQGCTPPIASTSGLDKVYLLLMRFTLMFYL